MNHYSIALIIFCTSKYLRIMVFKEFVKKISRIGVAHVRDSVGAQILVRERFQIHKICEIKVPQNISTIQ